VTLNLKSEAAGFADELADLLNGTICKGIRLTSVISEGRQGGFCLDNALNNTLLHYDYERDKPDGYPEAHL
jgi:hypothetical protein